jgi:subfamily B ATP-binding cassette protein MsbA
VGSKKKKKKKPQIEPKSAGEILHLAGFLWGFVKPLWKLLVIASVATMLNGFLNQGRALFAGLIVDKVLGPEIQAPAEPGVGPELGATDGAPAGAAAADAGAPVGEASPPDGLAQGDDDRSDAAPADAEDVKRAVVERMPYVSAVKDWWQRTLTAWTPSDGDVWGWAWLTSVLLAVVAILLGITSLGREYMQAKLVQRVLINIRIYVMHHLIGLGFRFFHSRKLGDLYSRLTNDISQVNRALNFLFKDLFQASTQILSGVIICLWASWELTLVSTVGVLPIILVLQVFSKKVRKRARSRQQSHGEVTEAMQQMLSGIRIVKAFHAEEHEVERFRRVNEGFYRRSVRVVAAKAGARSLTDVMNHMVVAGLILGGVWYFHEMQAIEKQWLVVFLTSLALMYQPAKKLVSSYNTVMESLAGVERVQELLDVQPEIQDRPGVVPVERLEGRVRLAGVGFAYGDEPVLRDVSLDVEPGQVVAFVGPSGAGKSTLIDLLARLYDPTEGSIEVDGHDIRDIPRADLLRHLAIVTQDPFLFNTTIIENLRYGKRDATYEEAEAACRAAHIHDAIAALPDGYDATVGERGVTLSGGQRQRLTIARALLRDPRILLLDEATSALDSESEKAVQQDLEVLMEGRTTFVVAHRLSTVVGADRIVVLSEGRVVEQGTHESLLADADSLYGRLYRLQTDTAAEASSR